MARPFHGKGPPIFGAAGAAVGLRRRASAHRPAVPDACGSSRRCCRALHRGRGAGRRARAARAHRRVVRATGQRARADRRPGVPARTTDDARPSRLALCDRAARIAARAEHRDRRQSQRDGARHRRCGPLRPRSCRRRLGDRIGAGARHRCRRPSRRAGIRRRDDRRRRDGGRSRLPGQASCAGAGHCRARRHRVGVAARHTGQTGALSAAQSLDRGDDPRRSGRRSSAAVRVADHGPARQ